MEGRLKEGWGAHILTRVVGVQIHRGAGLSQALVHEAIHNSSTTAEKGSDRWKWSLFTKVSRILLAHQSSAGLTLLWSLIAVRTRTGCMRTRVSQQTTR